MRFEWARPVLAGFRIIATRQWSYLVWCAAVLACGLVSIAIAVALAGGPGAVVRSGQAGIGRFVLILWALGAVLGTPIVCAIYRAVLRPADSRSAYLRLGGLELRMAGLLEPLACAWILVVDLAAAARPWSLAVSALALLAATPFTLLGPVVFDRGRYDVGYALRLGRRFSWELLGLNILTWALIMAIDFLIHIGWSLFISFSWEDVWAQAMDRQDPWFFAQMLVAFGIAWLFYVAELVIAVAAGAEAYRWLAGSAAATGDPARPATVQA